LSWPAIVAILLAAPTAALAQHQEQQAPHPRDWSFALQTGAAIGFFFPHYGRLTMGLGIAETFSDADRRAFQQANGAPRPTPCREVKIINTDLRCVCLP
jgi:hypothetical protein